MIDDEIIAALEKIDKLEGDARLAFLDRLGQIEEDLRVKDFSGIPFAIGLLFKALEQDQPSYTGALARLIACATRAARLTEGKTRLNDKGDNNDLLGIAIRYTGATPKEEFERDFLKLPLVGQELITRWNNILSLPRVETLRGRVTVIKRSFKSAYFSTNWSEGLRQLVLSKFLTGGGGKRWKANIDWFLAPPNLQNILAGQYDDHKTKQQSANRTYDTTQI